MCSPRLETAKAYLAEEGKHSTKRAARLALVTLPSERNKGYAIQYRESPNTEALRQYVKSLMRVYRNYVEKQNAVKACDVEMEWVNELIASCKAISLKASKRS
jgi:hypothetical protein